MTTRTEAIKNFLTFRAPKDLADLYDAAMEVQVNVLQGRGEPLEEESPDGRPLKGFRDSTTGEVWKSFRIPWATGDYDDSPLYFALDEHAEAIGLTGRDWQAGVSRWVGYDFDSVIGHKKGLSDEELSGIVKAVSDVPWVTTRRSRSGRGIHLYVHLDPPIETANRAEHAALARSVLMRLSAAAGVDLHAAVDCLGSVLWVWHRQVKAGGLTLLKQGSGLEDVPANWRDHLPVTTGKTTRMTSEIPGVDDLVGLTRTVPLDAEHRRLLGWFSAATARGAAWWWDGDRHMLVCHTNDLKAAHAELGLKGVFYTNAASAAFCGFQNCFAFPSRQGGWSVRRHGHNTAEHATWTRDAGGWTRCTLNRPAELKTVASAHKGLESSRGEFVFRTGRDAIKALKDLGVSDDNIPDIPPGYTYREGRVSVHDAGRLLLQVGRDAKDEGIAGWLPSRKGDTWDLLVPVATETHDGEPPDDQVRHVVAGGKDAGWYLHARGTWVNEPRQNVSAYLIAGGTKRPDVEPVLGRAISAYWELVNLPFQPEYPGNRRWNKFGARLAVVPVEGTHPTWNAVLSHCGHALNKSLKANPWAIANAVRTGADYLRLWLAAMFQQPLEPLPYLFLYGPQGSGKSTLHEALWTFFTSGLVRADTALTSNGRFNAELAGSVLCVVEETNLRTNKQAYDRIKDWVTGRTISIHEKGGTPYDLKNSCHWIQCANAADHCPMLPGDTRIVMLYVDALSEGTEVPKPELMGLLQAEAPAFLHTLLHTELPASPTRLRVPVVDTPDKLGQMEASRSELDLFIGDLLTEVTGAVVAFEDFYERFQAYLPVSQRGYWSKVRVGREFSHPTFVKGRYGQGGQIHIGNCTWVEHAAVATVQAKLVLQVDRLVRV